MSDLQHVTLRLPAPLLARVDALVGSVGHTRTAVVELALRRLLEHTDAETELAALRRELGRLAEGGELG